MRGTALYRRHAELRGPRSLEPRRQTGAVVVVGVSGAVGGAVARGLAAGARGVVAVLAVGESATDLAGDVDLAWLPQDAAAKAALWRATLAAAVEFKSRRGGCAGLKRGEAASAAVRAIVVVFEDNDCGGPAGLTDDDKVAAVREALQAETIYHVVVIGRTGDAGLERAEALLDGANGPRQRLTALRLAPTFGDVEALLTTGAPRPPPPRARTFGRADARPTLARRLARLARILPAALDEEFVSPVAERAVADFLGEELLASLEAVEAIKFAVVDLRGWDALPWRKLCESAAASSIGCGVLHHALCHPWLAAALAQLCGAALALWVMLAPPLRRATAAVGARSALPSVQRRGPSWASHLALISDVSPPDGERAVDVVARLCDFKGARPLDWDASKARAACDALLHDVAAPARHVFSDELGSRLAARIEAARGAVAEVRAPCDTLDGLVLDLYNICTTSLRCKESADELARDILSTLRTVHDAAT
ncbi:hypothetical protein M885DRAFT_509533 [Pelagophyceae sp. CCMP2097]|nr:hypothetical protein M885DRAFT_509533 [Pelagophyceae sp. CCMP2097]